VSAPGERGNPAAARPEPLARVRVHTALDGVAHVQAGASALAVEGRTRYRANDARPCALDCLLGALGADLALAFADAARREGVAVRGLEMSLAARADNSLVALGVVGEQGPAALSELGGSAFCSSDADAATLAALWDRACAASTVFATLTRAARVAIVFHVVP
jgi:hypothetical protein